MKILLVAATINEVDPFLDKIGWKNSQAKFEYAGHQLELMVTGVGMVATAFSLGNKLAKVNYDLGLNLGIAGAFDKNLQLGEVVEVVSDQFSEMGAEDNNSFLSLKEIGMFNENEFPFEQSKIAASSLKFKLNYKKVNGITVNTVHGNELSIESIKKRLNAQVESMEGAAFFYGCKRSNTNCIQLRAISNYVEKRNKSRWKIRLALDNLANETIAILKQI